MTLRAKALYSLFCLSVLLFVAKPFIGYSAIESGNNWIQAHSILVKSFSKRKPEDFREAEQRKAAIKQMLTNPGAPLMATFSSLLFLIFPLLTKQGVKISNGFLNQLKVCLIPADQPYLLTGKLTI